MNIQGIRTQAIPTLKTPLLVAGFRGWGNALDLSWAMVNHLIRQFDARPFAHLDPDRFYRYDQNRPTIDAQAGFLRQISLPGGTFYAAIPPTGNDLVLVRADEPQAHWYDFVHGLFEIGESLGVAHYVTLGSMYDRVIHSERILSALVPDEKWLAWLQRENVTPISYQGPGAIHALIQDEGEKMGLSCLSLWAHCPYYLEGSPHFGLMATLGKLLGKIGGFEVKTRLLEENWQHLNQRIRSLIDKDPQLQEMIRSLRKERISQSRIGSPQTDAKKEKVIQLKDFREPD